jgi:catechol 2,3-dioxygenase-like lactoylglutathione lyase family enzyme
MSRIHIHISVSDLADNIRFYTTLFGAEPTVSKPDYAKWELADPAVNFAVSSRGATPGLDHVGIQTDDDAALVTLRERLQQAGIEGQRQDATACCYARSDKYWTRDPQGIAWETFHTLDSIPTFSETRTGATGCVPFSGPGCC